MARTFCVARWIARAFGVAPGVVALGPVVEVGVEEVALVVDVDQLFVALVLGARVAQDRLDAQVEFDRRLADRLEQFLVEALDVGARQVVAAPCHIGRRQIGLQIIVALMLRHHFARIVRQHLERVDDGQLVLGHVGVDCVRVAAVIAVLVERSAPW